MSKKQIPWFWEAYILKVDCTIWLKLCLANVFAPAGMVVHYVICKRIRDCWCGLNKKTEAIPQFSFFYKHSVALEGHPCRVCVESEHLALSSVWVFCPHLACTIIHISFCHGVTHLLMSGGVLGAVVRLSHNHTESCPLVFQNLMSDWYSEQAYCAFLRCRALSNLSDDEMDMWHAWCMSRPTDAFSHEIVIYIYHQIGQDLSSFWLSLVNSSIFRGW